MKKNILYWFITFFCLLFSSCSSIDSAYIKSNGNYEYNNFFDSDSLYVTKVDIFSEFGIDNDEWSSIFPNTIIYKANSQGSDNLPESTVRQRTYDAINLVGKNLQKKYYGVFLNRSNCEEKKRVNTASVAAAFTGGLSGRGAVVSSPSYYYVDIWHFNCYAIFFDNLDYIPSLKEICDPILLYSIK